MAVKFLLPTLAHKSATIKRGFTIQGVCVCVEIEDTHTLQKGENYPAINLNLLYLYRLVGYECTESYMPF